MMRPLSPPQAAREFLSDATDHQRVEAILLIAGDITALEVHRPQHQTRAEALRKFTNALTNAARLDGQIKVAKLVSDATELLNDFDQEIDKVLSSWTVLEADGVFEGLLGLLDLDSCAPTSTTFSDGSE